MTNKRAMTEEVGTTASVVSIRGTLAATGMPLLFSYVKKNPSWNKWAVVIRDHMVEHTLGLTLAILESGVSREWVRVFDKGDATLNQQGIISALDQAGVWGGLLDNTVVNAPEDHRETLDHFHRQLDTFIEDAHASGKRVLVIDDGGLIAQGYASPTHKIQVDAAIELTMSGLDRISAAGELSVPVLDLARSDVKQSFGYREIAHSCVVRLQEMVQLDKLIGRPVLLLGFGSLGALFARELRAVGCRVSVYDPDFLRLSIAAEEGFATFDSFQSALMSETPFVIAGTSGSLAIEPHHFHLLPDHVVLAPFATKDFSAIASSSETELVRRVPGWGDEYRLPNGNHCTVLGNGRSLNLYQADSISPSGYDAYRTGVYLCAQELVEERPLSTGLHSAVVNDIAREHDLYRRYFETYLSTTAKTRTQPRRAEIQGVACVVGDGHAGSLHKNALQESGYVVLSVDPRCSGLNSWHSVGEVPSHRLAEISQWHICSPVDTHMDVLEEILSVDSRATIFIEKPAVPEILTNQFKKRLDTLGPRVRVVDQYRFSQATKSLAENFERLESLWGPPQTVYIEFSKDRRNDESRGRHRDQHHGALGYEWTHMLAVLRTAAPKLYADYRAVGEAFCSRRGQSDEDGLLVTVEESVELNSTTLCLFTSSSGVNAMWSDKPDTSFDSDALKRRVCAIDFGPVRITARFALGAGVPDGNKARVTVINTLSGETEFDQHFNDFPLQSFFEESLSTDVSKDSLDSLMALQETASALTAGASKGGHPE